MVYTNNKIYKAMSDKQIKITAITAVKLWNVLSHLLELSEDPYFTGWAKRLMAYMQPEIKLWNEWSEAERDAHKDAELTFPVAPLESGYLPDLITQEMIEVLDPAVQGNVQPYTPQLAQLQKKTKEKTK